MSRISLEAIARAFPERVVSVPASPLYQAGLAAVLLTLVGLQLLYLGLVLGAAYGTYLYMAAIPAILATVGHNIFTGVIVFGIPTVGCVFTFFLVKPLFAARNRRSGAIELTEREQPELFAFVRALCASTGSPVPAAIEVNLDPNAAASFCGLRGLFHNRLKLTIGLPLVEGLTLRQFAGVLAHEIGHFSQTAGLRSYFLIQSVQVWFFRVVYERDTWDARLEEWTAGAKHWGPKVILGTSTSAVSASRWILFRLMKLANLVSCGFSRQMEYNADRYEAAIVGSRTFAEIAVALPGIAEATERGWHLVNRHWTLRRLPDTLPRIAANFWRTSSPATKQHIEDTALTEQADRWATHPSAADRIANVDRYAYRGSFTLDGPAAALVRDLDALGRRATSARYGVMFGDAIQQAQIVPFQEFIVETRFEEQGR